MGRPAKVGGTTAAAPPEPPRSESEAFLDDMEDEGQRSPEARVRRLDPSTRKYGTLDVLDAAIVDEPFVRENYGGGDYQVLIYGTRPQDKSYGYLQTNRYRVDPSVPFKGSLRDRLAAGAVKVVDAPHRNGDDDDMKFMLKTQMLEMMRDQTESRNQNSMALVNMMKTMSDSSMAMMSAMTTMMSTMRQPAGGLGDMKELIGPLLNGFLNKKDPMEMAIALAGIMKPNTDLRDTLSMIREMQETSTLFGARGDGDDDEDGGGKWFRLVEKVLPGAIDILKRESEKTGIPVRALARGTATAVPLPPPRAPVAGVVSSAPPRIETPPVAAGAPLPPAGDPDAVTDEWTPFEAQIAQLVGYAENNAEPADVAAGAMLMIPPVGKAQLREWLAQVSDTGAWLFEPAIFKRFPAMAQFPSWFTELCTELRIRFGLIDPDDLDDDADDTGDAPPAAATPAPVEPAP